MREGNFLGVVATNEWAAIKGAKADQGDTGRNGKRLPDQAKLCEHVRATKVVKDEVTGKIGNTAEAMASRASRSIKATYDFAINTHGSIGPSCAMAEFKDGKLTSWSASQATHDLRKQLAEMFSLPAENVRCIYLEGSGCYGRNGHEDAAADAALLAKAVGKPVRVQWSRADEHGWDPKGPPTLMDLRAGMDALGQRHRLGRRSSSFRSRRRAASWCRWSRPTLAGMPAARPHRAGQHVPEFHDPLQIPQHQSRLPAGWRRRRSARPGSGRRGACRTLTPTNASWTNWRRPPTCRPARVPPEVSRPPTSAGSNCSTAWQGSPSGRSVRRRKNGERQCGQGARRLLCQI